MDQDNSTINTDIDKTIQTPDESHGTIFWYDNIYSLFENLDSFFPTYDMDLIQKLNAIMRFAIYVGIILTLLTNNYLYLYIPVGIGIFTIFIQKGNTQKLEQFFSNSPTPIAYSPDIDAPCTLPTPDNPFMNFNNITDDRERPPACKTYNNKTLQNNVDNNFEHNLYRDVSDLYNKNNSQREFYTMPSTSAVSDQTSFAKWLYNTGPTCKEDATKCAPEWSPTMPQQVLEKFVNT